MGFETYKPIIVMIALQFMYAGITLSTRASLVHGMSSKVFVVYRQTIAFLLIVPIAFFSRKIGNSCLGWKSFWLIFLASLIGVTLNQNLYAFGLYLTSSSTTSAMFNLVPAVTFLLAWIMGLEEVHVKSLRSMAKLIGTILCVCGAVTMALLKGPKLLNANFIATNELIVLGKEIEHLTSWLLGCFLVFASACCWSFWLILQRTVSATYPDHLSFTAWLCLMASLQTAFVTLFLEPDMKTWKLTSSLELISCFYTGFASAVTIFGQAWCISRKGPLFSATFQPLSTVIITIFASIFMKEEMYIGSLVGSIAILIGLYVVLWGKAKDKKEDNVEEGQEKQHIQETTITIQDSSELEEPLLTNKSTSNVNDK